MGRHRRSAAGRAATGPAAGATGPHTAEGYAGNAHPYTGDAQTYYGNAYNTYESDQYLYAVDDSHATYAEGPDGQGRPDAGSHRHKKRAARPVRTGLLGVSVAVALGAIAVASGVLPGGGGFNVTGGDKVRAAGSPTASLQPQGGTDGTADLGPSHPSRVTERPSTPSASPSTGASATRSAKPTHKAPAPTPSASKTKPTDAPASGTKHSAPPTHPAAPRPKPPAATPTKATSAESAAEAEVLSLVNKERSKVGCSPVSADTGLAHLAENFSEDMEARNFFDHTDPDGASPWDRAAKAGITDLGGENIARGQSDAQAVMDAWMGSPGHRANILNCQYKTIGIGAVFGSGGPWWTQDFGF